MTLFQTRILKQSPGISPAVQWWRHHTFTAGGMGSISGRGTKDSAHMAADQKKSDLWLYLLTLKTVQDLFSNKAS